MNRSSVRFRSLAPFTFFCEKKSKTKKTKIAAAYARFDRRFFQKSLAKTPIAPVYRGLTDWQNFGLIDGLWQNPYLFASSTVCDRNSYLFWAEVHMDAGGLYGQHGLLKYSSRSSSILSTSVHTGPFKNFFQGYNYSLFRLFDGLWQNSYWFLAWNFR